MTEEEFDRWFARASDLFPGIGNYFAKTHNPDAVQAKWLDILAPLEYIECKAAIDRIYEGDLEQPRSMSELPKTLRILLRRERPTKTTAEKAYCRCRRCDRQFLIQRICPYCASCDWDDAWKCTTCRDQGVVIVWLHAATEAAQKAARTGNDQCKPKRHQVAAVRCNCSYGQSLRHPRIAFDEQSMPQFSDRGRDNDECFAKLREFIIHGHQQNPFQDFNNS